MGLADATVTAIRGLLSLNAATVIRTLRAGPRDAKQRLIDSYIAIDPFSRIEHRPDLLLLNHIPQVKLTELVQWPEELSLYLGDVDVSGSTPLLDLLAILALAIAQQPKAALEFGTFWGSTTVNLARNLPNAIIHTIDLPPDTEEALATTAGKPVDDVYLIESRKLGQAFSGTPFESHIVQHLGDTATYDYNSIKDEVSFFLIDGSHTYEYAKSDTLHAFDLARGNSTFVWHDCDEIHPGVTRWLGELVDRGLQVKRIEGTVIAYLRTDAADITRRRPAA